MTGGIQSAERNIALVLSGGGAYGAYEVGVMKALFSGESPASAGKALNSQIFTGTSVGAFNAAAMTMHPGADNQAAIERLETAWLNDVAYHAKNGGNGVYRIRGNPLQYLDPTYLGKNPVEVLERMGSDTVYLVRDWARRLMWFSTSSASLVHRTMELVDLSSFISVDPFEQMLKRVVDMEGIRSSEKILRIVATNWESGDLHVFSNSDMEGARGRSIIMASAAIPGIFPPVLLGADLYVDGGVVMNTPLQCALDAGAHEMHVIYMDPDVCNIPLGRLQDTADTFDRMYTVMLATKISEDIATTDWINRGLDVAERAAAGGNLTQGDERDFLRVAGQIYRGIQQGLPFRKITIHRYHPCEDLGGTMGMLNFKQDAIRALIDRGRKDAQTHDCATSGCLLPNK